MPLPQIPISIDAGLHWWTFPFQGRRVSWPHAPWRALVALLFGYKTLSWRHISFTNLPITSISVVLLPVVKSPSGWSNLFFCIDSLLLCGCWMLSKLTPRPQSILKLATTQKPRFICRFSSASAATSLPFQPSIIPSGLPIHSLKLSCRDLQLSHLHFFHLRTLNACTQWVTLKVFDRARCLSFLSTSANPLPGFGVDIQSSPKLCGWSS
jgi:hypothetical protein